MEANTTTPDNLHQLAPGSVSEAELIADIVRRQAPPVATAARLAPKVELERTLSAEQVAKRERSMAEQDACERRQRASYALTQLSRQAGDRFAKCSSSTYVVRGEYQRRVVEAVLNYSANIVDNANTGTGLVLYGPVGTGKDHLAYVVAKAAVISSLSVLWMRGQDWFGEIRDAMDTDRSEAAMMGELIRPAVLFVSDPLPPIGNLSQHQATMLYRLVEARYSRQLPTVVTVNVANDDEADARLGAPTWDRLCHGALKALCAWESFRKPKLEIRP